jgi:hypothetical protein
LAQLWTIIFAAVFALAFGLAHWHDCDEAKRREEGPPGAGEEDEREAADTGG